MSFLRPWALSIAALALVPILLHLFRRDVARRVPFPALRYLQATEREYARSIRLRDLLLLAIRAFLVLAIALAAAGPLIGRGDAADHTPTDVAILLDNSASTLRPVDGGTALDDLLQRARMVVAAAGPDDRFWILPAVGSPPARNAGAAAATAALERIEPTDGAGDLLALVRAGLGVLPAADARARELLLLSDLQASGLSGAAIEAAPGIPLVVGRALSEAQPNAAAGEAELSTGNAAPAGLEVQIATSPRLLGAPMEAASGAPPSDSAVLRLEVDGRTEGLAVAEWGSSVVLRLPTLAPGSHAGRIEIEPSALRADDSRYFSLRVHAPPSVTHEGPPESFLADALATLRAAGRVGAGPQRIAIVEGGAAGLGSPGPPADARFFLPPADPFALPRFNRGLAAAGVPWSLSADSARGELRLAGDAGVPGLADIRVTRRYRLTATGATGSADTLLRTEDREAWLVRGEAAGRPFLLLLSPLVPEATSLPVSPAMIPFIEATLLRWGLRGGWPERDVEVAETVRLPPRADSVMLPDGTTRRVEGGSLFVPLRAGIYRVFHDRPAEPAASYLAANVPLAESDLRALPIGELETLLGGLEVVDGGADADAWEAAIFRSRRGADAAPWLLALALACALAEATVAAPARRRSGAGRAAGS
ncbi:MAG: BatA domain-containing protein [Gemmatimonadota bacterium]